jgi:hypothetical protein
MAGVKAKREGVVKPPVWTVTDCSSCSKVIDYTDPKRAVFPAVRVLSIVFNEAKGNRRWSWRHKACA